MRSILFASALVCCLSATSHIVLAQSSPTAEALVKQGVGFYDQGQYQQAITSYEQALKLEPTNGAAQYELAMTYNAVGRNDEAVALCKRLLKQNTKFGAELYSTYGNALDGLHKPKDAVKIYSDGIKQYPNDGALYYNMGITQLVSLNQVEPAIASMQQAVRCRPGHANSHAALASLTAAQGNRVAALLETMRLLQLEPEGKRATENLTKLDEMMGQGVKKTGEKSVSINLSPNLLTDAGRKSSKPDNFTSADMLLTMSSALDFDEKNKDKAPTERFIEKFSTLCQGLGERDLAKQEGFVWQYYVPYFVELEKKGHVPALTYMVQASRAESTPEVAAWLNQHQAEVQALQAWSAAYSWPK